MPLVAEPSGSERSKSSSLENQIRWLATQHGFGERNISVTVIDDRGRVRVGINRHAPFKPASNMKVLTTAAALHLLGASYEFETQLLSTSPIREHAIEGDLILRGTGDPNISGRFYDGGATALLRTWARQLNAHGLWRVSGDLIVDDSFFDDVRFLPSWDRGQEGRWYSAQISSLSFNDNCIDVSIHPARSIGSRARVSIVPACSAIRAQGAPRTVPGSKWGITIHRKTGTNDLSIGGKIGQRVKGDFTDYVTVDDPAMFFGSVLARVLAEEGIEIAGRVRRVKAGDGYYDNASRQQTSARSGARESARTAKSVAAGETLLVRHTSTLEQDLAVINKNSQNLHAEILLKSLGARVEGSGSVEGGARAIRRFVAEKGLRASGLEVRDGSGLSHENRVSSGLLAGVLRAVMAEPYFETFRDSLAVAGTDGTLRSKFWRSKQLHGRVMAKTGNISGVSSLSGYLTRGSKTWCFSILVNGFPGFPKGSKSVPDLQEKILNRLDLAMR